MKKLFYLISAVVLASSSANAGVRSIVDWDGGMADLEKTVQEGYCAKECEGYDISIVRCGEGEVLVDCPVKTCEYFHRCEPMSDDLPPSMLETYKSSLSK